MHCVLRGELKNNKFFVCRNNRIILPKRRENTKHNANWSAKKNEQCKDAMNAFYCILENLFSFWPLFLLRCGYTYARDAFRSFWLLNSVRARCSSLRCAEFFNRRKKMIFFGKVAKTTGYSKFECVSLFLSPSIFLRICCASIHMFSSRLASNCDLIAFCLLRAQPAFKHVLVYLPFLFSVCRISAFAFLYYSRFWVQTLRETKIMSFCRWKKSARACIRSHRRKKRWLRVIRMKINLSWTGSFPATEIYFELRKINFFYSMNFQFKNMKLDVLKCCLHFTTLQVRI